MRNDLITQVMKAETERRLNVLRELLQWEVIASLYKSEAFSRVAFIGGTSLRLLHGLGRFSEDLDFSTIGDGDVDRDMLMRWGRNIKKGMARYALAGVEFNVGDGTGSVLSADVRFAGIMKYVGLSPMESAKLRIKIEIDTNPPDGANLDKIVATTPDSSLISVGTYDLESLMAGKIHALLARPYTKGRDWYDLLWYAGNKIEPNLIMLDNALGQIPSQWCEDAGQWREGVRELASCTDWPLVVQDVGRFLEDGREAEMLNEHTVLGALRNQVRKRGI